MTRPNLGLGPLAALCASLLAGAALGLGLLVISFDSIPTDVARLGVLTRALKHETPAASLVVFGNSALMSGFDGNAFLAANDTLAWNCASTGQTLSEAVLLTQELPDTVDTVIYALQVRAGEADRLIHPNKFNTFFMTGLRPNEETKRTLQALGDEEMNRLLESSWLGQVAASRWAVRQLIDRSSRRLLRSDLELEKATVDLFHPQAYSKPIAAGITRGFIAGRNKGYAAKPAQLPGETLALARTLAEQGARAGRDTVFLFPPSNPGIYEPNADAISRVIAEFRRDAESLPRTRVIDAINLLPATAFVDDMHPTNEGAAVLTEYLGKMLAGTN